MKKIALLFSVFCLLICNAQKTDLLKENLKGKVKYIVQKPYDAVEVNGEVQKGKMEDIEIYDERGNLIEENKYNSDGNLEIKTTYKYQYDNNGNWISKITYENDKPFVIIERTIEYY